MFAIILGIVAVTAATVGGVQYIAETRKEQAELIMAEPCQAPVRPAA